MGTSNEVIILHKPTGTVASCDCEHSQHRNKAKALANLRSKLYAIENVSRNDDRVTFSYLLGWDENPYPDNLEEFKRRVKNDYHCTATFRRIHDQNFP